MVNRFSNLSKILCLSLDKRVLPNSGKRVNSGNAQKAKLEYDDEEKHLIKEDELQNMDDEKLINLAQIRKETEILTNYLRHEHYTGIL